MAKKATNPQNLRPFPKGVSGNPEGRKPGVPNAATRLAKLFAIVQKMKDPFTGQEKEFTIAEMLDMAVLKKALNGDMIAYKELMDRTEGKAKQTIDATHNFDKDSLEMIFK